MNSRLKLVIIATSSCLILFLLLGTVLAGSADQENTYRHFEVFAEVLSRIKSEYVEEPDMKDVTLGALNGLLEAIDPYASYLNADQYQQYLSNSDSKMAQVGLTLSRRAGYVSVVDSVPNSPAAKLGLSTGDILETINGIATRDMPLAYAEMLMKGEPESKLELKVLRIRQSAEPQDFTIVRQPIAYPAVRSAMLDNNIGHLRVQSLETGKTEEVTQRLESLLERGAEKIILDLRRSSTGDPEEGIALADLFLDEGTITYLEGQKVARKNYMASSEKTISRLPMVVVINRGSARGAEIAAAALLENKLCEAVGERTYGDAAIREAVSLNDGGAVILSVAKFHSPSGKSLQDTGVTPSVIEIAQEPVLDIEEDEPSIVPHAELPFSEDTILQKAIEVLTEGVKESAHNSQGEMAIAAV